MVQIHVRQCPIENGDSCQVGSARGEAFFLPAAESQEQEKMASVFYGVMIPMLTPLIYSLRNQDVREALKGVGKKCF